MMDSLLLYKILKNRTGAEISASGNPAIMSDTLKNNPMNEMKVYGWSKQETTKGKNLFDFSAIVISIVIGMIGAGHIVGIGIGTVVAMICTGRVIAVFNHFLKKKIEMSVM